MARFDELAEGWISGRLTGDEVREFLDLVSREDSPLPKLLLEWLQDPGLAADNVQDREERLFNEVLRRAREEGLVIGGIGEAATNSGERTPVVPIGRPRFRIPAVAAALLLLLGSGWWLFQYLKHPRVPAGTETARTLTNDLPPGGNRAILTLAGGRQIVLDSTANGTIARQSGSVVIKSGSGKLSYQKAGATLPGDITYNTLSTPRGGQYQLTLPDGTRVWLDAASSITYPTVFTGAERSVKISGQAYFEVTHRSGQPFRVAAGDMEVAVLGTSFNVNAYTDESAIRTTLLEGAVIVRSGGASKMLHPGEQSVVLPEGGPITLEEHPDVEQVMAWKNELFAFHDADLPTIMRQVSRWYDVDIEYTGTPPAGHYNGRPSRNLSAAQMLKIIEYSGVKYHIEGKKIIIE